MGFKNISWPDGPAIKQNFSFPMPIIRYMANNPSSFKVCEKLYFCCKFFFEENPLLVVHRMHGTENGGMEVCSYNEEKCKESRNGLGKKCCIRIDLDQIPAEKIWLGNELYLDEEYIPRFAEVIRPKFYRCDTAKFCTSYNVIAFDNLKELGSTFKKLDLEFVGVNRGTDKVSLERILGAIPEVEEFSFNFRKSPSYAVTLTNETFKTIRNLDNFGNLKLFELEALPAIGYNDFDELALFIQEHANTKFYFNFHYRGRQLKRKMDALIDDVLKSNVPYRLITYHEQDNEKLAAMKNLCDKFFNTKWF